MRIPKLHLYRMGSDPEFLFVKPADFDFVITPACKILGKDKAKTAHSFIGCDNRPVIAEIRPSPSRNLVRHMYDLAYAIHTATQYVGEKHPGHLLYAGSSLHNENLGGHIHVSGFIEDPMWAKLSELGYFINHQGTIGPLPGTQVPMPDVVYRSSIEEVSRSEVVTPYLWAQIMNYLLEPFEFWFMPWVAREKRNVHYGGPLHPDVVRDGVSKAPFQRPGMSYFHWEYRLPSSWLMHPHIAYTYLALAKLTTLNFSRLAELWLSKSGMGKGKKKIAPQPHNNDDMPGPSGAGEALYNWTPIKEAENDQYLRKLTERIELVKRASPIISNDIKDVWRLLDICGTSREKWFDRPRAVMIEDWRRLL